MCNRRWIPQARMHRYCFFLMSRGFHDRAFHERSMGRSISDLSPTAVWNNWCQSLTLCMGQWSFLLDMWTKKGERIGVYNGELKLVEWICQYAVSAIDDQKCSARATGGCLNEVEART